MLKSIVTYAKQADVGIEDMSFEIKNEEISTSDPLPDNLPEGMIMALKQFSAALKDSSESAEMNLKIGEIKTSSLHHGINKNGQLELFSLELSDESDGTRRLMSLAPGIEQVLNRGAFYLWMKLTKSFILYLLSLSSQNFKVPETNPGHAQIIFTTHDSLNY